MPIPSKNSAFEKYRKWQDGRLGTRTAKKVDHKALTPAPPMTRIDMSQFKKK